MANTREIQSRIKSVKDTMKITNAMYMISSSKLKKARKEFENANPYFITLQSAIKKILKMVPDVEHRYFCDESYVAGTPDKRKGIIVVTADKGLAGAYNHNVIKLAMAEIDKENVNDMLFVVGNVGRHFFQKTDIPIDEHFAYTAQNPSLNRARNIAEKVIEFYDKNELDEIYIIYTNMINSVQTEAKVKRLLPLRKRFFSESDVEITSTENLTLLPSAEVVFDNVVPDFVAGYIYGALINSYTSEQNARMMAMQAATDSASEMLKDLSVMYNRARQSAITQEITEVISGAKSQKNKG
ncbi:MAG: ATP synthase F1 subunit gamma [Acutalibacteraceae bacterium]